MKKIATFILICINVALIHAQVNIGGKPYSFNKQINIEKSVKNKKDKVVLPSINLSKLQSEDQEDEANGIPPRFGFPFKVIGIGV